MSILLAIDPGPVQSGYVVLQGGKVARSGVESNEWIKGQCFRHASMRNQIAIEMIASYGMPVGKEVFETCLWIGRFVEVSSGTAKLIYRKDVRMHLCNSMRAKDSHVWQAILDLYGGKERAVGSKKAPGPLYGVKSHARSALAVALTAMGSVLRLAEELP